MSASDENEQPVVKKVWATPEIRDQSIKSLTEGKPATGPNESSSSTGPS